MKKKEYKSVEDMIASGYARTSNAYGLVARIDREDWREHMAERHSAHGTAWVHNLGERAADQYRRVYSKDTFQMGRSVGRRFPPSERGPQEFMPDKAVKP